MQCQYSAGVGRAGDEVRTMVRQGVPGRTGIGLERGSGEGRTPGGVWGQTTVATGGGRRTRAGTGGGQGPEKERMSHKRLMAAHKGGRAVAGRGSDVARRLDVSEDGWGGRTWGRAWARRNMGAAPKTRICAQAKKPLARKTGRASPWPPSWAHGHRSRAAAAALGGAGLRAGQLAAELEAVGPEPRRGRGPTAAHGSSQW